MFLNGYKSASSPAVMETVTTAVGSQRTPTAQPLKNTHRHRKIPRCAQRTIQKRKRLFSGQAANPSEHQGCKETDQPSNLADTTEPLQKRPRTGRSPEEPATQPIIRLSKSHWTKAYLEGELLGAGGFGCVFAGIRKEDGLPVAIKFVSKMMPYEKLQLTEYGWLPVEIALMVLANSKPCSKILKILDWYEERKRYVVILERPEPCLDLEEFSSKQGGCLTESEACIVMWQLMVALKHCKSQGILHRDVKPENILIQTNTWQVKLFDFGCGDLVKDSYNYFAGTRQYAPPEWFVQGQYRADPATVWSVGVTLYRLVCGCLPFRTPEETKTGHLFFPESLSQGKKVQRLISYGLINSRLNYTLYTDLSRERKCSDLIRWCLSPDAEDRPSLQQIELHHWFNLPD
ncbi:serine/threonine-protein kinase pim-1-like [Hemibagrus wyckioides]|uniref:serine/threonine-protein kinase pim-1-like n=1 Tax=Hemibagrus wyckioides TaxID=337641 RepID=UPI00266D1655|nr:serine/threonine-protein kinase pim-1-like [Hemibagrus wyckioides]